MKTTVFLKQGSGIDLDHPIEVTPEELQIYLIEGNVAAVREETDNAKYICAGARRVVFQGNYRFHWVTGPILETGVYDIVLSKEEFDDLLKKHGFTPTTVR